MSTLACEPLLATTPLTKTVAGVAVEWGRKSKADKTNKIVALALILFCPALLLLNSIALEWYGGSLRDVLASASENPLTFAQTHIPSVTSVEVISYGAWLYWQAALYTYLPGKQCSGQLTPGGHVLRYTANGLYAWIVTHALFFALTWFSWIDPTIIAKHWKGLLIVSNAYGFALALLAQLKGYFFPSFPEDCKLSGSWVFDFWGGVELNPRIASLDLKFFHNGRPGIVAWTLINFSWASHQYQYLGYVSQAMLVLITLQMLYVIDFLCNEAWYTHTVDISHDHFGFMLAWGDTAFLPAFYTLQAQYLGRHEGVTSSIQNLALLGLGVTSYVAFRAANHQRHRVRRQYIAGVSTPIVWNRPATLVQCRYFTANGIEHQTVLLASGWWGMARHFNYMADLVQAGCMCAVCGLEHVLPWLYFFYMAILLYHRAVRDDRRCRKKYGQGWKEYCNRVPYRLIPGVY